MSLRDQLRAKWSQEIVNRSRVEQEAFLASAEGPVALGARRCHQLLKKIRQDRKKLKRYVAHACSDDWARAILRGDAQGLPLGGFAELGMVLSRQRTRYGENGHPTRRFTPAMAVGVEDAMDAMTAQQALFYQFPASPSADVIRRIGELRARQI